ncbi:MAG: DUF3830 family protein [Armatimonadota bacterium]|nr:DUF3830 family protein [Armatimonadota bacterium]
MSVIRIEFERGGTFHARLLEDAAPKTCRRIKARLPFAYRFHHSIVSGQALVTLPPNLTVPRENQRVAGIPPGTLSFLVRDEPVLVPDEIYIAYGIFISRGLTVDTKQPVNVFAQIDTDLEDLKVVGNRVLMQGAETVRFSLAGPMKHVRRPGSRARNS